MASEADFGRSRARPQRHLTRTRHQSGAPGGRRNGLYDWDCGRPQLEGGRDGRCVLTMLVHGKCHCGEISYEAKVIPGTIAICHCSDCQAFAGAAYRAMIRPDPTSFKLNGTPKRYTKTADSGRQRVQGFCGTCGSHLYAADPDGGNLALRIGVICERRELGKPVRQLWCDSALSWAFDLNGIPQADKQG